MAAKKHRKRTATDKTTQGHLTMDATSEAVPAETVTSAEFAPVETANAPTTETTTADSPMVAEVEPIAADPARSNQAVPVKKLSAVDAAAKVLGESGQAMNCQELIAAMADRGYWSSPKGRTPAGTLHSAVPREIQTKGDQARFRKTARGQFALRETV